jgi:hypothetical protein
MDSQGEGVREYGCGCIRESIKDSKKKLSVEMCRLVERRYKESGYLENNFKCGMSGREFIK